MTLKTGNVIGAIMAMGAIVIMIAVVITIGA